MGDLIHFDWRIHKVKIYIVKQWEYVFGAIELPLQFLEISGDF